MREHERLHHRVHDRQDADRRERREQGLDGMLGDAVHAPALADQFRSSSGAERSVDQERGLGLRRRQAVGDGAEKDQDQQQLAHGAIVRRQGKERLNRALFGGVERLRPQTPQLRSRPPSLRPA